MDIAANHTQAPPFEESLKKHGLKLERTPIEVLQINIGKLCNQACLHCHVEAGPKRTENMTKETLNQLVALVDKTPSIHTVDITGGAPELNPNFKDLCVAMRKRNKKVIDRCNLTVLFEPGQEETAAFLAAHQIEVVASLPCYSKENVEKQRGNGVFKKSIEALKKLNSLGYGKEGTGLSLHLVYNPGGAFLPPSQEKLRSDYKRELKELFDIEFNDLFTITNMPIKRFLRDLERESKLEEYMQLLLDNFNPAAVSGLMCKNQVSVGHDGSMYDCDFNQMLEIPLSWKKKTIFEIESFNQIENQAIALAKHCYGCTAGAGSSCGGALA